MCASKRTASTKPKVTQISVLDVGVCRELITDVLHSEEIRAIFPLAAATQQVEPTALLFSLLDNTSRSIPEQQRQTRITLHYIQYKVIKAINLTTKYVLFAYLTTSSHHIRLPRVINC